MTIKTKLLALIIIPVVGILALGVHDLSKSNAVVGEMDDLQSLTELAVTLSATIHETQKERGRTAGFLGSRGQGIQARITQTTIADRYPHHGTE